jgi:hypothetical protein
MRKIIWPSSLKPVSSVSDHKHEPINTLPLSASMIKVKVKLEALRVVRG